MKKEFDHFSSFFFLLPQNSNNAFRGVLSFFGKTSFLIAQILGRFVRVLPIRKTLISKNAAFIEISIFFFKIKAEKMVLILWSCSQQNSIFREIWCLDQSWVGCNFSLSQKWSSKNQKKILPVKRKNPNISQNLHLDYTFRTVTLIRENYAICSQFINLNSTAFFS